MSIMRSKTYLYYDVFPKVVETNKETKVVIKPIQVPSFNNGAKYSIKIQGKDNRKVNEVDAIVKDGSIIFTNTFEDEQEQVIVVYIHSGDTKDEVCKINMYSVDKDLFNLRPFKGDFHLHSTSSDGQELPTIVAGYCRKVGLDFMANTDHRRYNPSTDTIKTFKDLDVDLKMFPGEEVHFHGRKHLISYGGDFGLGEMYSEPKKVNLRFKAELVGYKEKIKDEIADLPENIDGDRYARTRFAIDKIRETNALCIYAHPHWISGNAYHSASPLFDYLYQNEMFDAFELFNGDSPGETNVLQVAYFQQERAKGNKLPIVTGTDSHDSVRNPFFGKMYTIVFSENCELKNVKDSILKKNAVACINLNNAETQAFGQYRLVKYALYLERDIFPYHDELCFEEGRLMNRYIAGDKDASKLLSMMQGRVKRYYDKIWG